MVGAGPGVSGSVARLFAGEGYDVGLLGHDPGALEELTATLQPLGADVEGAAADVTRVDEASAAVRRIGDEIWTSLT